MQRDTLKTNNHNRLYQLGFKLLKLATRLNYPKLMAVGRFLGRRQMQLDAEHTRIAAINLDTCFPILSPQQQRELLRLHFEHVGMGLAEMAFSWWASQQRFDRIVHVKGLDNLHRAFRKGHGVILATAQFTTTDILVRYLGHSAKVTGIYKPHHNEFVDECIRSYRNRHLHQVLMFEDITAITDALKQNHAVLFTHDAEPAHKQYVFSDFFNIPAATNTAISRFARMSGAEVIPVHAQRRPGNDGYNIIFESPLPEFPGENTQRDTQRLCNVIERWVEKEPEQYGWSFPRFRIRPEGEPRFY